MEPIRYAACQQLRRFSPTVLQHLACGSIILFGSRVAGHFVLDTLFVVSDSEVYSAATPPKIGKSQDSADFNESTLRPLYDLDNACSSPIQMRLYRGATFSKTICGMFSFFPCKQFSTKRGFARPWIKLGQKMITQNLSQSFKVSPVCSLNEMRLIWGEIVQQVESVGLDRGLHAKL
jgi:hypothetical protein